MLLNKTSCKCGRDLRNVKFEKYEANFNKDFYGGRVDMYGYIKCECGRELKGYFSRRNTDQTLWLIDLEVIKDTTEPEKIVFNEISLAYTEPTVTYTPKTYEEMTWNELKAVAKEKGIKGVMKREKLIEKLREL